MARSTQHEWFSIQRFASPRRDPRRRRRSGTQTFGRRLRIEPLEERRLLAVVTIDTLDDTVDFNDGVTSLREALFATNLVGGADTIEFAASLTSDGPATLTLTHGELPIADDLTINGPGADLLTIDASGNDPTPDENNGLGSRIFNIDDGDDLATIGVSISGLTLTGGDVSGNGGAIRSLENLAVTESIISGNSATSSSLYPYGGKGGGIFSRSGELTVTDSTISGNLARGDGGGIHSQYGNLTVTESTINGNSAGYGGGGVLSYSGNLIVIGSTISGNSTNWGAGIYSRQGGTLTVNTSTISDNLASSDGGGIFSSYGIVTTVTDSTISGNESGGQGGGILSNNGNLTVTLSTISGNSAFKGGGIYGRESLFGRPIGEGEVTVTDTAIEGNSSDNGGGGGISSYNCDFTVTGSTISGNSTGSRGGGIYSRQGGNLTVDSSTISGNSAMGFFGDGGGGGIFFQGFHSALTVTLSTISGNSTSNGNHGGGIYSGGTATILTVTGSTISNNSARYGGGGIWNYIGDAAISSSTISGNSVSNGNGGGISSSRGHLTVTNSSLSGNVAGGNFGDYGRGGGIYSRAGSVTVTGCTISGNLALSAGGGIFSLASPFLMVTYSTISGNFAFDGNGGGIYSRLVDVTMIDSTLSGNSANHGNGGGLYVFDAASAIRHSTVTGNSADIGGGGAFIFGGSLALDHTILAANDASLGPDLTGLIGTVFDVRFSLIGDNAHSGLAATPNGVPDANGNLIGPVLLPEPLVVYVEMAAMGDFEAGLDGDSFLFEYSIDGGAFQPLFTSSVDEAASQTYFMDRGTQVVRDDPLSVNGVVLNNEFQSLTAEIPASSGQIRIRFTATNDGPSEAFAWRNLYVAGQNSGALVGAAVRYDASSDRFAAYAADPDYTISGDMFGIRSRLNQGIPSLPFDIADDSRSIFPGDVQGIIGELDVARFFGVVDTVNGVGSNTDTATWTFNNVLLPIDPLLGPLADNGGPTLTHALLVGSPAIDAGDPAAVAGMNGVPQFDQRGNPFARVVGAAIDVGAFELPPLPPDLLGDYNCNGTVEAADYAMWRNTLHSNVAPYSGADGSGNGVIDKADYGVWKAHFGEALPPPGAGSGSVAAAEIPEFAAPNVERAASNQVASDQDLSVSDGGHGGLVKASHFALNRSAVAARHDDALLAWVASATSAEPDDGSADLYGPSTRNASEILDDWGLDVLDAAFGILNGQRGAGRPHG